MVQRTDALCDSRELTALLADRAQTIRLAERGRCVGIVLAAMGRARLAGEDHLAIVLDALATALEHPEAEEGRTQ